MIVQHKVLAQKRRGIVALEYLLVGSIASAGVAAGMGKVRDGFVNDCEAHAALISQIHQNYGAQMVHGQSSGMAHAGGGTPQASPNIPQYAFFPQTREASLQSTFAPPVVPIPRPSVPSYDSRLLYADAPPRSP
jgi:hypothetical protein